MKSIWLTGADGFVGSWLRGELNGAQSPWAALGLPETEAGLDGGVFTPLDLAAAAGRDVGEAVAALKDLPEPSGLIHLAALSSPPACEANPELAQAINVDGPARFYEQLLELWPQCPIVHVSSGHVYRPAAEPLREDEPLEPVNVYGRTKLEGEAMAHGFRDRGARLTVVRPFNHTGAGQLPNFALPSFAMRLAKLEQAGGGELEVGWLGGVRDFLHVRSVISTYLSLLPKAGEVDLVNVCSGVGHVIGDLLDGLVSRFEGDIRIVQAEGRLRGAADADRLVGDTTRLAKLLGAAPVLDLDGLLDELAVDARARLASGEDLSQA
ncbi:MAG: NAD-dependent epimerase/dehydratase family protein [Planctomycetota bacterium]|jgi:GDP-4-dehydro-6-deoxy-D-mannose reductase|nr:NAD-dependent epimerase/dehydratase family protein [Planctomycetota bacterium]